MYEMVAPTLHAGPCCGAVKAELAPWRRTFRREACRHALGRDIDAAHSSEPLSASIAVTSYGEERSGPVRKGRVELSSVDRERGVEAA